MCSIPAQWPPQGHRDSGYVVSDKDTIPARPRHVNRCHIWGESKPWHGIDVLLQLGTACSHVQYEEGHYLPKRHAGEDVLETWAHR